MLRSGIDKQFLDHSIAKFVLWQHPFYSDLYKAFWLAGTDFGCCQFFQTTWVARIVLVDFDIFLVTGKFYLGSIDYNHIVSGVHVWGVFRVVFAPEDSRDTRTHAAQRLAFGVYHKPGAIDLFFLDRPC